MKRFPIILIALVAGVAAHAQQTKTMTGTVVDVGATGNWGYIVIQVGNRKYGFEDEGNNFQIKRIGNIGNVGDKVTVYYNKIDCIHAYIEGVPCWLDATKIVGVKNSTPSSAVLDSPQPKATYYLSVSRCDAGQFSTAEWQQLENKLKRSGIPAFFAMHETSLSQSRSDWLMMRIIRHYPAAHVDALLIGPFDSKTAAKAVVKRFSAITPNEGAQLSENGDGDWQIGCFAIIGMQTSTKIVENKTAADNSNGSSQTIVTSTETWDSFWTRFKAAIKAKNHPVIKAMSLQEGFEGNTETVGDWLRNVDNNNWWHLVQASVETGSRAYQDPETGRAAQATRDGRLHFIYTKNGWRFAGPTPPE